MSGRSSSDRTQNRENPTRTHPQEPPCLHELFREQARRTPDGISLVGDDRKLTYRELDELSDRLAAFLRESGVGRDVPVGIHLERSLEYVVAMLATLKSGGAFLPLELAYPARMTEEIISDSKMNLVLTKSRYEDNLSDDTKTFCLDDGWADDLTSSTERLEGVDAEPDDLAFISYSSGTTGKPKGIANPHRAMVGSYLWRFGVDAPEPGDRVGCNVFFIWEALRPLLRGAATVVVPDDVIYSPDELTAFLKRHAITETLFTPSLLETILNRDEDALESELPNLKTLWLNGEVVTKRLARRAAAALPEARLLNVYSISEAHEVAAGDLRELADLPGSTYCAVGRPANPETARILDDELEAVPPGEAGELYVGGDWLAREYIGLPEKTAERFSEDPLSDVQGERIYRTGDRARFLPGGELEILGRADFMVKVRGYSIELGAVETAIEATLPVAGCCVIADGEEGTDKRLVAYVVASGELPEISAETGRSAGIRETLKEALPHYAIPSVYVELGSLPLQETTGKVDRTELPPPPAKGCGARSGTEIALPENPSERDETEAVRAIFEVVLGLDAGDVGEDEDFFEIGGHSLAAAEVLSLVEDTFGVRLGVSAILDHPSPIKLRRVIARNGDAGEAASETTNPRTDAKLEAEISPKNPPKYTRLTAAKSIFLTGATGFFGAFFLRELLEDTAAEVSCLVRRRSDSEAPSIAPVRDNMRGYGLWKPEYASRLKPVAGDLSSPLLGLVRADFDALTGSVEVVVHAAAAVNLVYPYSALRAANVEGTREVLRLCTTGRPKTLHYVSTNGIFPPGHGLCRESENIEPLIDDLEDGYGQTKWAAERLVSEAVKRGLPALVYRPGNISGDTKSGAYNRKDLLSAAASASLSLSLAPEDDSWRVEMTPVDFVAAAVFALADRTNPDGAGIFHLANPSPPKATKFFDLLGGESGSPLGQIPLSEWMARLTESDVPGLAKAIIGDGSTLAHAFATGNTFDDTNTRSTLDATETPERPPLDASLLGRYAKALRNSEGAG